MFTVVTERRTRRVWTPRTVAASTGAHVVLLGIFVTAAESGTPPPPPPPPPDTMELCITCEHPPTPPPSAAVGTPPPMPGRTAGNDGDPGLLPPDSVPHSLPAATGDTATGQHPGYGAAGDGPGAPAATPPHASGGGTDWAAVPCDSLCVAEDVTVLPRLANEREAQRMLQRVYPPRLRDARITGTTTVTLVIDRQGNVEPGSVGIQSSTHPGFEDAALRAAETFHFTPAEVDGRRVSVIIALPIQWRLQN